MSGFKRFSFEPTDRSSFQDLGIKSMSCHALLPWTQPPQIVSKRSEHHLTESNRGAWTPKMLQTCHTPDPPAATSSQNDPSPPSNRSVARSLALEGSFSSSLFARAQLAEGGGGQRRALVGWHRHRPKEVPTARWRRGKNGWMRSI